MTWFYLALLAPLLYAAVNLLDDSLLNFVYKSSYLAAAFAGLFGALPLVALLVKWPKLTIHLWILAVITGFVSVAFYFYYFKSLESDTPGVVVAILCLAPATLPLFAHFLVDERLNGLQIFGFCVILLASLGIAATNIKKLSFSPALWTAVTGALLLNIVALLTKYIYQHSSFYSGFMGICAGAGLGGLSFYLMKRQQNRRLLGEIRLKLKRVLPFFVLAEGLAIAAQVTHNLAISRGPLSLVEVLEGLQPMFVLLIALTLYPLAPRYFREAERGRIGQKLLFMGVILIGLAIIARATK